MAFKVGNLLVTFQADIKNFLTGVARVQRRTERMGRRVASVGQRITTGLSIPLGLAAVAVTRLATTFDEEMTKIETLVGVAADQVAEWRDELLRIAPAVGRGPGELAQALFVVTSAGERTARALNIVELAAKASAVGLGDTATVARAATAIMNVYGKRGMTAARAMDILTAIVREGNLEAASLAGVLGRVISITENLGISFEDAGAFIATFTRAGVTADEAVTGLRSALMLIMKPGKEAEDTLRAYGLSMERVRNIAAGPGGLVAALGAVMTALEGDKTAIARVFPNFRALPGVLSVAVSQAEAYAEVSDNIAHSTGILDEAFERVSETAAFKFRRALAGLQVAGIQLGSVVLPTVVKLTEAVTSLVTAFTGLPRWVKVATVALAGFLAVLGPILMAIGNLILAWSALQAAFIAIAGPVGLAIAALAALAAAAIQVARHWDWVKQQILLALTALVDKITEVLRGMATLPDMFGGGIARAALPAFAKLNQSLLRAVNNAASLDSGLAGVAESAGAAARAVGGIVPPSVIPTELDIDTTGATEVANELERAATNAEHAVRVFAESEIPVGFGMTAVADNISAMIGTAESAVTDLGEGLEEQAESISKRMAIEGKYIGENLVLGIVSGTTAMEDILKAAFQAIVRVALAQITGGLSIFSPSRVMQKLGEMTGRGFALGLSGEVPTVAYAAGQLGRGALAGAAPAGFTMNVDTRGLRRAMTPREAALQREAIDLFVETYKNAKNMGAL